MKVTSMLAVGALLSLLSFSQVASARDEMPCPTVDIIQQTAPQLGYVVFDNNQYIVSTLGPILPYSGKNWLVGVIENAKDRDEALVLARQHVKGVTVQHNKDAIYMRDKNLYVCGYQSGDIAVVAITRADNSVVQGTLIKAYH
ncbi:MAG: hypothetical protein ACK4M7_11060 [Burkholderiales bacterium]